MLSVLFAAALFAEGRTEWVVSVPDDAARPLVYAAEELTDVIRRISGVTLETVSASGAPMRNVIRLETSGDAVDDEFSVSLAPDEIRLVGSSPRATLFAAYAFLRDCLGVRWYWPGTEGEFLPRLGRYDVPNWTKTYRPAFRYREMSICGDIWQHRDAPTERWFAKVFLNCGLNSPSVQTDLGFVRCVSDHWMSLPLDAAERERLFAAHPDWFALVNGQRSADGIAGCWSNEGFYDYMVSNLVTRFRERQPEIANIFVADVVPRCECASCTADPDRSARWWTFYARLIAGIRREIPGQRFAGLAYQEYRAVPGVKVADLEYVEYCHYNRCYFHRLGDPDCARNASSMEEFRRWAEQAPLGFYGYEFDVFSPGPYLPMLNIVSDEMRTFRDMGLVRVKTELGVSPLGQSGETPRAKARIKQLAQRLGNYAWATMAFDPNVTPEDVLRDFCEHVYGEGAEEMIAYHGLMERVWGTWTGHITNFLHDRSATAKNLITEEVERKAHRHLTAAVMATADDARARDNVLVDVECFGDWLRSARGHTLSTLTTDACRLDNHAQPEPVVCGRGDTVDIALDGSWYPSGSCELFVNGAFADRSTGEARTVGLPGAETEACGYVLSLRSAEESVDRTLLVLPWAGYHRLIHSLTTPEMALDSKGPSLGLGIFIR